MKLKAGTERWNGRISPMLSSNFIELGYGWQVEAMIAEQFFNRSFEPFYPYVPINKAWYDLYYDERHPEKGYETDWSRFDWYHSGYEHNSWYAWPGTQGSIEVTDDSTFVVNDSSDGKVHIELVPYKGHGAYAMKVVNRSESETGGLAQDGKYMRRDTVYSFRGKLMSLSGKDTAVTLCIMPESGNGAAVSSAVVTAGGTVGEVSCEFTVPEDGRYSFVLLIGPGEEVLCDDFSMLPGDSVDIWKKSAVETCAYVAPKLIRFPGGCFASFYDWKEGIGKQRDPGYSYFWGGYNYNDVGTDEFARLCEAVNCDAMICLNMYHPFKRFYELVPDELKDGDPNDPGNPVGSHRRDLKKFADIEQGAEDAAAWVEYCNGGTDTYWGRKRAENGHPEPYGIRYWELDNEVNRWFRAEEYARACSLYSRKIKAADPEAKVGMISYSFSIEKLPEMLEICGKDIDFLADRSCSEKNVQRVLDVMHAYNNSHGTCLKYCNTEWLPITDSDQANMYAGGERDGKCYYFSKWIYALDAASMLMMWQRHGEDIGFINFNNLANTHSQSAMETPKEGAYPTASGMILRQFSLTRAAYPLKCTPVDDMAKAGGNAGEGVYAPGRNDPLQVQVSLDDTGSAVVVDLLNRSEAAIPLELDLTELLPADRTVSATGNVLSAPSRFSMNRLNDMQISSSESSLRAEGGIVRAEIPALSYSEFVFEI